MTTLRKDGGRDIALFLPFEHGGESITQIGLAPVTWNHTLKWQGGEYNKATDLLFDLAEQSEDVMRSVRYPDIDRIMTQFYEMMPPEIRDAMAAGTIPRKVTLPKFDEVIENDVQDSDVDGEPVDGYTESPVQQTDAYEPYRFPTKEDVEEDMKAHPAPEDPFGHLPKDENGLGFEVNDG